MADLDQVMQHEFFKWFTALREDEDAGLGDAFEAGFRAAVARLGTVTRP